MSEFEDFGFAAAYRCRVLLETNVPGVTANVRLIRRGNAREQTIHTGTVDILALATELERAIRRVIADAAPATADEEALAAAHTSLVSALTSCGERWMSCELERHGSRSGFGSCYSDMTDLS